MTTWDKAVDVLSRHDASSAYGCTCGIRATASHLLAFTGMALLQQSARWQGEHRAEMLTAAGLLDQKDGTA